MQFFVHLRLIANIRNFCVEMLKPCFMRSEIMVVVENIGFGLCGLNFDRIYQGKKK